MRQAVVWLKGKMPSRNARITRKKRMIIFTLQNLFWNRVPNEVFITHSLRACLETLLLEFPKPCQRSQTVHARWLWKEWRRQEGRAAERVSLILLFCKHKFLSSISMWIPATAYQNHLPKTRNSEDEKNILLHKDVFHSCLTPATQHQTRFGKSVCWFLIRCIYRLLNVSPSSVTASSMIDRIS